MEWVTYDWLRAKRRHVISTLEGVSEADAMRGVAPSGWSLAGLVHHLALDVERVWFRVVAAGEDAELVPGGAWRVPDGWKVADVVELYREEIARADDIVMRMGPAARLAAPPADGPPYRTVDDVVHHVLAETAVHAGHADLVRELIDGHQRLVLD